MTLSVDLITGSKTTVGNASIVGSKLAVAAKVLAKLKRETLDTLKASESRLGRPDFLWHALLESFSTMGGADGWKGLIGEPTNYDRLRYDKIAKLSPGKRPRHVLGVCRAARVRYPERKARFIVGCFDRIEALGGLKSAKAKLLAEPDRETKLSFLKAFPGIGPKYARNLMMDVYHADFRDSIAIDSRIKAISEKWGLTFDSYGEHEAFYLSVAKLAGLSGWELDRLMFWHQSVFFPPIDTSVERAYRDEVVSTAMRT